MHENFKGNEKDLLEFEKLCKSPIRSPQRDEALLAWEAYKKKRVADTLDPRDKTTKGGHMQSLGKRVIDLSGATLDGITVGYADMRGVILDGASLKGAWMKGCNFFNASFRGADFCPLNESRDSRIFNSNFHFADFSNAILENANLHESIFRFSSLQQANLKNTDLRQCSFTDSDLSGADLSGAKVYGVSAWNLKTENMIENDLQLSPNDDSSNLTVDGIEMAQFFYLLMDNRKIRNAIDTIGKKGVLLLGRFTPERKIILDTLRTELRKLNFLPIMFDFDKPADRDFTETIRILAGLSRFVIADITSPKSSPLELQATIPDISIPFIPIIAKDEQPFSMFKDLKNKYEWVADPLAYQTKEDLVRVLKPAVVDIALNIEEKIRTRKNQDVKVRGTEDY